MTWHRHVFETMGTVASISFEADEPDSAITSLHATFAHYDAVFSLYMPQSELSRIASARLTLADASDELREAYTAAIDWRAATHGDFTPNRPDGIIDLSGIVKAMAMDQTGRELRRAGVADWCLNVGGDVLTAGLDHSSNSWSIGIADALDRESLITAVHLTGSRKACATSGSAERGDHIWSTTAGRTPFIQATVVADDIITADVFATAIIAGGDLALDRICAGWDVDVMTIDRNGDLRMTPGFNRIPATI